MFFTSTDTKELIPVGNKQRIDYGPLVNQKNMGHISNLRCRIEMKIKITNRE